MNRILNAAVYLGLAFLILIQQDEEQRLLIWDFHGLMLVMIVLIVKAIWDLAVAATPSRYDDPDSFPTPKSWKAANDHINNLGDHWEMKPSSWPDEIDPATIGGNSPDRRTFGKAPTNRELSQSKAFNALDLSPESYESWRRRHLSRLGVQPEA